MAYFNYRNLNPTEFEALAKDVMERRLGCRLFRYAQGQDGGIDLCDDISNKHVVVQCKRYQQGSFDSLYGILKREERPKIDDLIPRPEKYYVFTSLDLLPEQKKKILDLFREYMTDESCIVDGIAINDFFRDERNHDLISRNIKLFLSFPENYRYSPSDLSQVEANRLHDQLLSIFENDRKNHPSIRMMDPNPSLFPKGLPEILSDGRLAVEEESAPRAIRDMIRDSWRREDQRHILLIGEGGIGKTVAMLTLPTEDWFKRLGIPVIYVPLQRLDAYEGDLDRYIKNKIGSDNYERCIELANRTPEDHPCLLVLLDGFNEIPDRFKQKAGKQIREWMERPGIQIVTTSRLGFFLENRFSKYRLQPLPYDTVRSFLLAAGIAEEQLPGQKNRIWGVINVPLMLAMYVQIEKVREAAELSPAAPVLEWKEPDNAAHIIWNYLQMELYRCTDRDDPTYSALQYAVAILAVAPYICCQMSSRNRFYIKREELHAFIREALSFYASHQSLPDNQILKVREEFDPYHEEELFLEEDPASYARILIDNIGLFQMQRRPIANQERSVATDYTCSLMHQNFRDALAAFYISSCLPKACGAEEKRALLDQADHYVKDYMAEHLSGQALLSVWDRHRKEDPEDGHLTFILMDLIGRQRNYDYRELDLGGIDLTKTNVNRLLSRRLDICPLPEDGNKLKDTRLSVDCLSPTSPKRGVTSVAFSPDGRLLACGGYDYTVWIWDLEDGDCRVLEGHTGGVYSVAFSPDGRLLASGGEDKTVRIWSLESGDCHVLEGHTDGICSVAFSSDGRALASGSYDSTVRIWDLESGDCHVLEGHTDGGISVAFSPNGRQVASGGFDRTVRIWDPVNGKDRILNGHTRIINSLAFSPDGRHLASGADDCTVRVWDLESGDSRVLAGNTYSVRSVAFSPDGRSLAASSGDAVRIWDLESSVSRLLDGHAGEVWSVAFSPDGRRLACSADDCTVRIWNLENSENRILEGYTSWLNSITFSPDGRLLAGGGDDFTVRIWNLESGNFSILKGHEGSVNSVAFSPDTMLLASGSDDHTVRVWSIADGGCRVLDGHEDQVCSVSFSPDGKSLASGSDDHTVRIWNLADGGCRILEGHWDWSCSVTFSPDGKLLAIGTLAGPVRIRNLESGESRILDDRKDMIWSVAFSPDGSLLAIGSHSNTVRIWDLKSGGIRVLEGHEGEVWSVSFSPDGRLLASGSEDCTVRVWDLVSGECHILAGHTGCVKSVSFDPGGRLLASCGDSTVRIWNLDEYREVGKYAIISHVNLSGANFELAVIDENEKAMLKSAGARI